jgi:hypothetical protein
VKTERWWSGSEWTSSTRAQQDATGLEHRRVADRQRRVGDQHVEVHRHRDRPTDRRAGPERDVDGAEHLLVLEDHPGQPGLLVGADAELGEVRPPLPGAVQHRQQLRALRSLSHRQRAALDGQHGRRVGQADRGEARGDDRALAAQRGDEALATGQVAERARLRQVAVVGDRRAPAEVDRQVGAPRAGHVRAVGGGQEVGDRA